MRRAGAWAESVFHVLAHVDPGPLAASAFNAGHVAWAAERLGPAEGRELGEDRAVLVRAAPDHEAFARMQAVAWLFETAEEAAAVAGNELASLPDIRVRDARALAVARAAGSPAEILRAAAELEVEALAAALAGEPEPDLAAVASELETIRAAAPGLGRFEIRLLRALGPRGRVLGDVILAGAPGADGPTPAAIAWQIAHEATVSEVSRATPTLSFVDVERQALGRLALRASRVGLARGHSRWLARLDRRALGSIPDIDDLPE